MSKYIAYYRLSKESRSGENLGLSAQQHAVKTHVEVRKAALIAEYQEIESGKRDTRPQLKAALEHCKRESAVLLVAKLDRLSRNVAFIFTLRDSGVRFECCDMPEANTMTIGIMAVFAQAERERISQRTKEALAQLKAQGKTLGNPRNFTEAAQAKGSAANRQAALDDECNQKALAVALDLRTNQGLSFSAIAEKINGYGLRTLKGNKFTPMGVYRLLKRGGHIPQ